MSNTKPKIACNFVPSHIIEAREILSDFFDIDYVDWNHEQIIENIGKYNAFLSSVNIIFDKEAFESARNLKVLATPSTGRDHLDLKEAEARGVAVLSLKNEIDYLRKITSTAEQALNLMLSCMRMLPSAFDAVKQGVWNSASFRGHSVSGKILGIIGFGRLGSMMARYGHALWMNVIATDPYKKIDVDYVEQVTYDELLQRADVISIHVHLNDETRGLLGRQEFEKMKDGVVIVNTSRGAVIDEAVLVEMLELGKVGGAGLDVLATELYDNVANLPIVKYAREHQNVVISPHIGGVTYESQELAYKKIAIMLREWFEKNSN